MIDAPLAGIRLIATDLDGTLLAHDKTISPRNLAAIHAAQAAGIHVVAATGRYPSKLPELLAPTRMEYAIASNGAMGIRLATGESFFQDLVPADTVATIIDFFADNEPEARFEVVQTDGRHFIEPGYFDLVTPYEREMFPLEYHDVSRAELSASPVLKVAIRHPGLDENELYELVAASALTGFHPSTSGAPFLEIAGPGVTKASGVAHLCRHLGITSGQVLAFGDARNDVEMLEWAGVGVAMGNAVPEAIEAADHTTATNQDDGLARAIERLLG